MAKQNEFDAIVVGSGITGGWAAKELTEKGLKVLLLERGRHVEHGKDYIGEHRPPWDFKYRDLGDRQLYEKDYKYQRQCYALTEATRHFFVNDRDNPYTHDEDKPFLWIRGYQLGGRSLLWGRQCYRWSDLDFEANAKDGYGVDWPIRYKDIEPWYDHVERFVGISGQAESNPVVPDGQFLPPMALNCVEQHVRSQLGRRFKDRVLTIGRVAVLTQAHNGRQPCHYCGPCERGCSTGSYFSTQSATLPAAVATGNLTLKTDSIVRSIIYDEQKDKATGVRVLDAKTNADIEYTGRVIFLCASTLGSTHLLLNSPTNRFPNGLANSSGVLGHYLMDHTWVFGAFGEVEGFEDMYYLGNRPTGIYVTRFRNVKEQRQDFLRGFAYQGGGSRSNWARGTNMPGFGADFKHALRRPGQWQMRLAGFGEMLPYADNFVELNHNVKDKWGLPTLKINCTFHENEYNMMKDMHASAVDMLEASGAKNIGLLGTPEAHVPGIGIHEMGTARMGKDPGTSVLNGYNQAHDIPNLFVTDGACMTSSAVQNPSITYMALTARACNYAVEKMKRGEL
jgi:choline dehydrogenase-like flavoprotein